MKTFFRSQKGSALIIILPIIALVTVIILSVMLMSLYDSHLAFDRVETNKTSLLTQYAIDDVADKLASIPLDRHWAAGPGLIRYCDGSGVWDPSYKIELFSGVPVTPPTSAYVDGASPAKCVHLNVKLADGSYTILPPNAEYAAAPDMTVNWIYVLQDGTTWDPSQPQPANDPVVGRYAYWTDVENGRVNLNTSGLGMVNGPPNPGSTTNPTGRFQTSSDAALTVSGADYNTFWPNYANYVWNKNPWMTDTVTTSTTGITFNNSNGAYSALDRATAQLNTIQNLTAHPSSIDLSFLDFSSTTPTVAVQDSFNTFRYAGSYFLRVDAKRSYTPQVTSEITPAPNPGPDLSVRFFHDPKDWELIVDPTHADPTLYQKNKGYLTVMGRSPDINPWGLPKMALSTTPNDGHALSDLTEFYNRELPLNANTGFDEMDEKDTRYTQFPFLVPPQPSTARIKPPYPLATATRTSFRDLTSLYYNSSNYAVVGTLMYELNSLFNLPMPGFNSLTSKYGASEIEQIGVEMMSYLDGTHTFQYAEYAPHVTQAAGITPDFYGLDTPMAAVDPSNPPASLPLRRVGTAGQFLLNEIQATEEAFSWEDLSTTTPYPTYALMPSEVVKFTQLPKTIVTSFHEGGRFLTLIRQPRPEDLFVFINLNGEVMLPRQYGFRQPFAYGGSYLETVIMANNVCSWNSSDPTDPALQIGTAKYDIYGSQKPIPRPSPAPIPDYLADNPVDVDLPSGVGYLFQDPGLFFLQMGTPPALSPTTNQFGQMSPRGYFAVGPFAPGTTVHIDIKCRLISMVYRNYLGYGQRMDWQLIPGIFADFPSGNPVDPTYDATKDPNDPTITSQFLDFDFGDFTVGTGTSPGSASIANPIPRVMSFEATDPRVTRYATDWKKSGPNDLNAGTMMSQNSTYDPTTTDDSDLSRPPSALQTYRGWNSEYQTESRILGFPGVGSLSSLPTGVDMGVNPTPPNASLPLGGAFQTLKFYAQNDNPPDWLFWNLFYVPFDRSIAGQTDGRLNINARLYPFKAANGTSNLVRERPLEALLGNRISDDATRTSLATAIAAGPVSPGNLPDDLYAYTGQICQVPGLADAPNFPTTNEYDQERLPRDLADIITTQCSDYRVFVVSQSLRQTATGQVIPVTTQRVEATLSRTTDMGEEGYAFTASDGPTHKESNVYLRSAYRPSAGSAPVPSAGRVSAELLAIGSPQVRSPLGQDHMPNTGDDWLAPQKIEITHYAIVK